MRRNANAAVVGDTVILVPYKAEHVEIYHRWMKDPFLLEMTASEPLSIDEEFAMQRSWFEDEKKCTFILVSAEFGGNRVEGPSKAFGGLIGDVNLYFNDFEDTHSAELEVMIAEESARRKGFGLAAVQLMMRYAVEELGVRKFTSKISMSNTASLRLFRSKLGFQDVSTSEIFQEVTLELDVLPEVRERIVAAPAKYVITEYDTTS
ncbi:hypothetical protein HK101_008820 [Irineochytrium annulatum]|nr:hypothetical protein HK101_008820 [Irineochytrium annulatum]